MTPKLTEPSRANLIQLWTKADDFVDSIASTYSEQI